MRASMLRQHLAARIASRVGTEFILADSLIGVAAMPRTKLAPAFEVELLDAAPVGDRQRATQTRVRRNFAVRLLHAGNPSRGVEQWDTCLDDEAAVRRALQVRSAANSEDALACVENTIVYLRTDAPEVLGGGEYRRTTLIFHIDYSEELD